MKRGGLFYLLLSLLIILVAYPMFIQNTMASKIFAAFVSLILVSGVYVVTRETKWKFVVSLTIAVPTMIMLWADEFLDEVMIEIVGHIFMILFGFFTVYCILSYITNAKKVTKDILAGAASAYLLIGISWSFLYGVLHLLAPGSFAISEALPQSIERTWPIFNYFSFTTLTTLGYGDITPISERAQSLAVLEAATGVLFSAMLIAKLVGTHLYQHMQEDK